MWLSLSYHYDSESGFDSGCTYFSVENHREYPALLENSAEEEKMQIDQVILLDISIQTPADYKSNSAIKKRPVKLDAAYTGQTVIWKDNLHEKIGFADQDHAQTFDLKDIKSFSIENMLPAKGGGEGYLNIQLRKSKTNICILRGAAPHSIDWLAERLTELSGKTVTFDPEYYNC